MNSGRKCDDDGFSTTCPTGKGSQEVFLRLTEIRAHNYQHSSSKDDSIEQ